MTGGVNGHHGNPALSHVDTGTEFVTGAVSVYRPNGKDKNVLGQTSPQATAVFRDVKVGVKLVCFISLACDDFNNDIEGRLISLQLQTQTL